MIYNCDNIILQLKVYASHGAVSHTVPNLHTEDIGFVLTHNAKSYECSLKSVIVCALLYDFIGHLIILFFGYFFSYPILRKRKTAPSLPYRGYIMLSTFVIGATLVVLEYVVQLMHTIQSLSDSIYPILACKLTSVVDLIIFLVTYSIIWSTECIQSRKSLIGLKYATFHVNVLFYLMIIYHYALPTFLLMLVYPTKVVAIVAYLTAFVYISITVSSIAILIFKEAVKWLKRKRTSTCIRVCARIYFLYIPLYAIVTSVFIVPLFKSSSVCIIIKPIIFHHIWSSVHNSLIDPHSCYLFC